MPESETENREFRFRASPWAVAVILLAGGVFRALVWRSGRLSFNSDMAIPGVGALRVLRDGVHLAFMPGQNYGGEFLTYYFLPLHLIFPPSAGLMRLGMTPFAILLSATTAWAAWVLFRSRIWALTALLLTSFPPQMLFSFTMHPASLNIVPTIAFNIVLALSVSLMRSIRHDGWTRANLVRIWGIGFLTGFAIWCYLGIMTAVLALMITVISYPGTAARLMGLTHGGGGVESRGIHALRIALQLGLLISLTALSEILLLGKRDMVIGPLEIGLNHLRNPALASAGTLTALVIISVGWSRRSLRGILGVSLLFIGLWMGGAPIIWHFHALGKPQMEVGGFVGWQTFWLQMKAAFHSAIPILTGFHHDQLLGRMRIPLVLRAAVLGASLLSVAIVAGMMAVARIRRSPLGFGATFLVALFALQILYFAATRFGCNALNPRYLLPLGWIFALTIGGSLHLLTRWRARLTGFAIGLAVAIAGYNIATCLDMRPMPRDSWDGLSPVDRALFDHLHSIGVSRVSCEYDAAGFWNSLRLSYMSDEEILFSAPAGDLVTPVRSERYQTEVHAAERVAYLLPLGPASEFLTHVLHDYDVTFSSQQIGESYAVFSDLQPDILRTMDPRDFYPHMRWPSGHSQ